MATHRASVATDARLDLAGGGVVGARARAGARGLGALGGVASDVVQARVHRVAEAALELGGLLVEVAKALEERKERRGDI